MSNAWKYVWEHLTSPDAWLAADLWHNVIAGVILLLIPAVTTTAIRGARRALRSQWSHSFLAWLLQTRPVPWWAIVAMALTGPLGFLLVDATAN
jgi:hypothetical protein